MANAQHNPIQLTRLSRGYVVHHKDFGYLTKQGSWRQLLNKDVRLFNSKTEAEQAAVSTLPKAAAKPSA